MLSEETRQAIRTIVQNRYSERDNSLVTDLNSIQSEATRAGGMQGRTGVLMAQRCENELRERARVAWSELTRTVEALVAENSQGLADDLVHEMEHQIVDQGTGLYRVLEQRLEPYFRVFGEATMRGQLDGLKTLCSQLAKSYAAEATIWTATFARKIMESERQTHTVVFNISGDNYGVLQAGANSSATANTMFNAADQAALTRALDLVETQLRNTSSVGQIPASDVQEFVSEIRTAVTTPRPNRMKVAALLSGLGTAIQTVGAFRPAYDALRLAAIHFGISLPELPQQ